MSKERIRIRKHRNAVQGLKYLERRANDVQNLLKAKQTDASRVGLNDRLQIIHGRISRKKERVAEYSK